MIPPIAQGAKQRFPVAISLLLAVTLLLTQASTVAETGTAETKQRVNHQYRAVLGSCAEGQPGGVLLLRVFGGFFPIPTTFVMVDDADSQTEFSDLANPWVKPKLPSTIFHAAKKKFDDRWGWLAAARVKSSRERCGLTQRSYVHVEQFGAPAMVITDGNEYLLLIGPIADAADAAIACYAAISPRMAEGC
jgi:hypothetical protein